MGDIDEEPELATNKDWRGIMARARKEKRPPDYPDGMSQGQLGDLVGCSQAMISKIEGADGSSVYIRRICRVLAIPLPQHFVDEADRAWSQAGHIIRQRDPDGWKLELARIEHHARKLQERESNPDPAVETEDQHK